MPFYNDLSRYRDHPEYPGQADWIARRLLTLRYDLAQTIVKDRRPNSLIVGTWNIRAFDGGIPRLSESLHYIAEIIAADSGIGAMMMRAKRFVHIDEIMAGILTIGILGLTFDLALRWLHRRLFPYLETHDH